MTAPTAKIDVLRSHMAAGDWRAAMKLAASWYALGAEKQAIERAWEAYARPEFQRQLGRDPDKLIDAGIAALESKYGASK